MGAPPADDERQALLEVQHALRERVKELTCLYDVSAILADPALPADRRMQAVVDRLPAGWQSPERAAARITLDDRAYASAGWEPSRHVLSADVRVDGEAVGVLLVAYREGDPELGDACFLEEERLLIDELAHRLGKHLEHEWGRERTRGLEERLQPPPAPAAPAGDGGEALLGASPPMRAVRRAIAKAAQTDATILILGESGTGKELVARAIHYQSPRSTEPFVPVNCAAIPESLVESELFGFVQGAFTGATHARAGFFQAAGAGTVFLDEVGETNLAVQAKLLRVLEHREIRMVGSDRTVRADARIVAATNMDVAALVRAGRFRADLYFRLNVLSIELPPLRERGDDVLLLLEHFVRKHGPEAGSGRLSFSDRALRAMRGYDWPGNVRELENLVHRLAVMVESGFVDVPELPGPMRFAPPRTGADLRPLAEVEREHVAAVLRALDGNVSRTARTLGIDRKTLRKKLGEPPE
jgi:DNA-binding NtrC family response regulator